MEYYDLVKLTSEVEGNISDLQKSVDNFIKNMEQEMNQLSFHVKDASKKISDNVHHARRLQNTMLTPLDEVKRILPGSFILSLPQNGLIGGDFYYIKKVDELIYFAAIDCTGHGIASSLITVIGHSFINDAVAKEKIKLANEVIKYLDVEIDKFLRHGEKNEVKDAMDIALCILNSETLELQFCGSKRPLYYFSDDKFSEIKGDRFDIGLNENFEPDPFENHTIQLKSGDVVYVFTDGYADQFDETNSDRLKVKPFKNLLTRVYTMPMEQQKDQLEKFILDWKGDTEQTDDILMIGVRI